MSEPQNGGLPVRPVLKTVPFAILDDDPFDDGDIVGGISAHIKAGNSMDSIVAFAVNERNYLRVQNGQLWKIIEKQRVIMEGLKSQVTELKEREEVQALKALDNEDDDLGGDYHSVRSHNTSWVNNSMSAVDIPSISEIRKSITEHVASLNNLTSNESIANQTSSNAASSPLVESISNDEGTGASKKRPMSTFGIQVSPEQVEAYTGLMSSFLPDSGRQTPDILGGNLVPYSNPNSRPISPNAPLPSPPLPSPPSGSFPASITSSHPSRTSSMVPTPRDDSPSRLPPTSQDPARPLRASRSQTTGDIPYTLKHVSSQGSNASITTTGGGTHVASSTISLHADDAIHVRVVGSSFQGVGADGTLFYILVKKDRSGEEWKIEKRYSDFMHLDIKLRSKLSKTMMTAIGKPPEKSLFTSVNPLKTDQRKIALEVYLQRTLHAVPDSKEIFHFLTTNISSGNTQVSGAPVTSPVNGGGSVTSLNSVASKSGELDIDGLIESAVDTSVLREGFLMKRGKNFGGWKPRYLKCKMFFLDYSDGPHRELINTISLKHCHVAPIRAAPSDAKSAHALVLTEFHKEFYPVPLNQPITEQKVMHRHVLAAENDTERDEWVALLADQISQARAAEGITEKHVGPPKQQSVSQSIMSPLSAQESNSPGIQTPPRASSPANSQDPPVPPVKQTSRRDIHSVLGAPGIASNLGTLPVLTAAHFSATVSSVEIKNSVDDSSRAMQQIPKPLPLVTNASIVKEPLATSSAAPGSMAGMSAVKGLMNMRNAFGKKRSEQAQKVIDPSRVIFGVPLEHSISISRISDDLELPSIVYRCIEYLDFYKASQEEGIYRLSGSSTTIQNLKYLFNLDGDVDLINCNMDMMDVHVVSGLLKLFLRELPTPILTVQLQRAFMAITELDDRNDRVTELSNLVSQLPKANYTLLQILVSHLVSIVQASDVNKMSVRNVGIVFAPTLGVPALVFILLLAEFNLVFCWDDADSSRAMKDRISELQARKAGVVKNSEEGSSESNGLA